MRKFNEIINDAIAAIDNPTLQTELAELENRIHVALIAAVYAGNIEAAYSEAETKFNGIGADSYQHRQEYMDFAADYEFCYDENGLICSDDTFNNVSKYIWNKYKGYK